jgi:hypothetical protein
MNCKDITEILDNRNIARLGAAERRTVEAHLTACPDCARDLELHRQFAAMPDAMPPGGFVAHCRARVAAASAIGRNQRVRSRLFIAGTLAAVFAVAALLLLSTGPTTALPESGLVAVGDPTSHSVSASVTRQAVGAPAQTDAEGLAPEPLLTVRVLPLGYVDESSSGAPDPLSAAFADELAARIPAENSLLEVFHAALVQELRAVPGLTLVEPHVQVAAGTPGKHYELRVGRLTMLSPGGKLVPWDTRYLDAVVRAFQLQPDGNVVMRLLLPSRIDLRATCTGAASPGSAPCRDMAGTVAAVVRELRQKVFPPDPSVPRQLQAKLQDSSLDQGQRFQALEELYVARAQTSDDTWLRDIATVRGALDLAAGADPKLRAQIWRALRGSTHPDLVQPMMASALQDSDDARMHAVATLAADFSGDPQVRATLEMVARDDPRPLVRALATQGLAGDEAWRQYVVSSLKDANRPAAERIEAFIHHVQAPGLTPRSYATTPAAFEDLDDEAIRTLAQLLPTAAAAFPGGEGQIGSLLSQLGSRYNRLPAVVDTLLHYLEHGTQTRTRRIAGEVLAHTQGNEPRVREALQETLAADPEPEVRTYLRQVMGLESTPTPPPRTP